jgi:hypothetical protein
MKASSPGRTAAILLTLVVIAAPAAAATIVTRDQAGGFHRAYGRLPEFGGGEGRLRHAAYRRDRRLYGGFLDSGYGGDTLSGPAGDTLSEPPGGATGAPAMFGQGPSFAMAGIPYGQAGDASAWAEPSGGPKIITIGPMRRPARFAKLPIVVYGRQPVSGGF